MAYSVEKLDRLAVKSFLENVEPLRSPRIDDHNLGNGLVTPKSSKPRRSASFSTE
jgi:hypothetical protein